MKLWRIAFVMLAAFSLASCSSDDKDMVNDTYKALSGISLPDWPQTGRLQTVQLALDLFGILWPISCLMYPTSGKWTG